MTPEERAVAIDRALWNIRYHDREWFRRLEAERKAAANGKP